MNTKPKQETDIAQPAASPSGSKKRVFWLIVGWSAAGFALYYAIGILGFNWSFMIWEPRADILSVSLLSAIPVILVGIWFLARGTRDWTSQVVSALVCLALVKIAMQWADWRPLFSAGTGLSTQQVFRRACSLVLCLPAGFWLWHLSLPSASRVARHQIIALATCVLISTGAVFNYRYHRALSEAAANTPKSKDLGEQISAAFTDALMKGGPAPKPDPKAWQRIRVGLSREEVLAILGQPTSKIKRNSPVRAETPPSSPPEWWEYGYSSAIGAGAADPRAYALFFDDTGHIVSFQEPSESN